MCVCVRRASTWCHLKTLALCYELGCLCPTLPHGGKAMHTQKGGGYLCPMIRTAYPRYPFSAPCDTLWVGLGDIEDCCKALRTCATFAIAHNPPTLMLHRVSCG